MKQNGFYLFEVIMACFLLFAATALIIVKLVGIDSVYSEGERTGVLVKLSKKGYFWKTWEGEMNLGGMSVDGGGAAVPNLWQFSVADDEIAKQGQAFATHAERVTVTYKELWKSAFWQGQTDYFATGFRQ